MKTPVEPGAEIRDRMRVVAFGGGHGLSVTLSALRILNADITAVVGVADDGGSSGRLREEFDVIPPGDLRMALAALCGTNQWGQTWKAVMQHRFGGHGQLAGHATGNLLITALWQESGDIVAGLDLVGALLGVDGRVLPVSTVPLSIHAIVSGHVTGQDTEQCAVAGQVALEHTRGSVERLWVEPRDAPATVEVLDAIDRAEAIVFGPGSWYTSVLPHLCIPAVREAIRAAQCPRILVLNAGSNRPDTAHFGPDTYLESWRQQEADVPLDWVVADSKQAVSTALDVTAQAVGAQVWREPLVLAGPDDQNLRHDPALLAQALAGVFAEQHASQKI